MEKGESGRERSREEGHRDHQGCFVVQFDFEFGLGLSFFGVRFELESEGEEGEEEQRDSGEKGWAGWPSQDHVALLRTC